MATNIPEARKLIQSVLETFRNDPDFVRYDLEERLNKALALMTRKVNKRGPTQNHMTAELRAEIRRLIPLNGHLQDAEIAELAGLTGAGAARVSEIRNGLA